jgi:hypothetical protein
MKSELVLFGQHINMAPRVNRRRLVVLFYGLGINPLALAHERFLDPHAPVAVMPSMSSSPEPIIQSTWMRLSLAPLAASSSGVSLSPSRGRMSRPGRARCAMRRSHRRAC